MNPACPTAVRGKGLPQAALGAGAAAAGFFPATVRRSGGGLRWALAALALLLLPACGEPLAAPMRLGTNLWIGHAPLFLARQQGLLAEKDFRLVEFSDAADEGRAFRNGTIEAACLTLDEVFYLVQDGMDPVILLVMDESHGGDVLLARPEIRSLADLRGKRVAVEVSAVAAYMLTRALQSAGLTRQDITLVYLPLNKQLPAYRNGEVDAVVTFDPVRTKLMALGAVDLFNSAAIPGEIVDVLVVRRDYLERNPGRAGELRRAWFGALAFMRRSPGEAARLMAPREQLSPAQFTASLQRLHHPDEKENAVLLAGEKPGLRSTAERLKAVMRQQGLLEQDIPLAPLFSYPEPSHPVP